MRNRSIVVERNGLDLDLVDHLVMGRGPGRWEIRRGRRRWQDVPAGPAPIAATPALAVSSPVILQCCYRAKAGVPGSADRSSGAFVETGTSIAGTGNFADRREPPTRPSSRGIEPSGGTPDASRPHHD